MCRYVVFTLPDPVKPRPDDLKRQSYYLPGDVITIVDDGVFLGADIERGYPLGYPSDPKWWRIFESPGVAAVDAITQTGLLFRDPGNGDTVYTTDLGYRTWKRARNIDLVSVAAGRGTLDNVIIDLVDLKAATLEKTPMPQSAVIG